jgi:hypothetical protein
MRYPFFFVSLETTQVFDQRGIKGYLGLRCGRYLLLLAISFSIFLNFLQRLKYKKVWPGLANVEAIETWSIPGIAEVRLRGEQCWYFPTPATQRFSGRFNARSLNQPIGLFCRAVGSNQTPNLRGTKPEISSP